METGKTGKYFKYAIGEIILVVIGILIALSINNWNEKKKEEKQIRNIYARIVKDFNQTATEIDRDVAKMDSIQTLMLNIRRGEVVRDSLLTNRVYFKKYWGCTTGFPDIKIVDTGVRLLESKIELDYELNNELTEALTLLYSEQLFEFEIDTEAITNNLIRLNNYIIEKGIRVDYNLNGNQTTFTNMFFEDVMFKNYFLPFMASHAKYKNRLKSFKTNGQVLIDKIKAEYNLE
jgi:hypothetical protein